MAFGLISYFCPVTIESKQIMERTVFNKAQLEMLDIMANIRSDEELDALKHAVSEFYARRADEEMEKLWQSGQWNEQTLKELGNDHYRTPYKQ